MKLNFVLVALIFLSSGVATYTLAYQSGRTAGLAEGVAARTAIVTDPARGTGGGFGNPGAVGTPSAGAQGNANNVQRNLARLLAGLNGTVEKVEGNVVTVTVSRGQQTQSVKVTLADGGTVEQFATGALTDVKPGARVIIGMDNPQGGFGGQGQQTIPAEVTARSLTIIPANFGQ